MKVRYLMVLALMALSVSALAASDTSNVTLTIGAHGIVSVGDVTINKTGAPGAFGPGAGGQVDVSCNTTWGVAVDNAVVDLGLENNATASLSGTTSGGAGVHTATAKLDIDGETTYNDAAGGTYTATVQVNLTY